ncbi:hypothetical protein E2320_014159, partial [Naja naja]
VEGAEPSGGNAGAACPAAQSRALKAGSLPRLVRHLLEAPALGDAGYRPAFLATYRCFARPAVAPGSDWLQCSQPPKDGGPAADFMGLEPHLREQLVSWLHWAWGSSPGPEKSLPDAPSSRGPPVVERGQEEGPG